MESESYSKILDCCLLRQIFRCLPYKDQLHTREVNKDWEDEACAALNNSKLHTMKFSNDEDISDFLALFYIPPPSPPPPMKLLPLAKVTIRPELMNPRLLTPMASHLGQTVRFLKIGFSHLRNSRRIKNMCEVILQNFVQLQRLTIFTDDLEALDWDEEEFEQQDAQTNDLPTFQNLRKIKMHVSTANLVLLNNLVEKVPPRTRASIYVQDKAVDLSGSSLSEKLNHLYLGKLYMNLKVDMDDEHYLLQELTRMEMELRLRNGSFHLEFDKDPQVTSENFKRLFRELLNKLSSRNQLQELHIFCPEDSYQTNNIELRFPASMSGLSTLEFCGGEILINGSTRFPNLHTLIDNSAKTTFYPPVVFTTVQKLDVGFEYHRPKRTTHIALSESERWSERYPNLTTLHVFITSSTEAILKTIFSTLTKLEELKVKFEIIRIQELMLVFPNARPADPTTTWNLFTGGISPVMDIHTVPELVIPHATVPRYDAEANSLAQRDDDTRSPSLRNLRNLAVLELLDAPSHLYYALVHLTATGKMKPLKKLGFQSQFIWTVVRSSMNKYYLDVLEGVHSVVIVSPKGTNTF